MTTTERSILEVRDLSVKYGRVIANQGLNVAVNQGEIVGLIGPNGAGKTSFVDAVTGFTTASGEILLEGRDMGGLSAYRRRRLGLARTWQAGELFGSLSVAENVLVAARPGGLGALWRDMYGGSMRHQRSLIADALEPVGLKEMEDRLARELPLGAQKLVGVARALVGNCKVLLLDEPAAGLGTRESERFAHHLRAIADRGPGVLLIDHDMSLIFDVCDRIYVMEFGQMIFSGVAADARRDERVIAAYLGAPLGVNDGS